MLERSYVVTISSDGQARSRIWKGGAPLPLGYPYRWILERTDGGIRIRDLASKEGELVSQRFSDIAPELIQSGLPILIPNSSASVRIKPVATLEPAFESRPNPAGKIQVYSCMGTWSMGSESVGPRYLAQVRDRKIFEIRKVSEGYVFLPLLSDLTVELPSGPLTIAPDQVRILSHREICQTVVRWGLMSWIFSSFENVAIPTLTTKEVDTEWGVFKRSLAVSAATMALLAGLVFCWPREKVSEIVPPQYAKVVLEKQVNPKATPRLSASTAPTRSSFTQAFRAQVLQSAANGLLKGGMTKLLQDSQFVSGSENSEAARALLKSTSIGLVSTAPSIGLMKSKSILVSALGGGALGVLGKEHVGYGTGDHASVDGQGKSFFSLDTGASNVDEGLTKDEVGEVIHRHISEIRYCYEAALVRTVDVEGKLTIGFTISGVGSVKTAEVTNSTLTDPGLDDCVVRRLTNWRFPQTKGGIDVAVNYPFIFKSLGR